ncbi:AAA domain family protein [Mycobacteroides abscessus subsp. bolletii 1513]|uniref:AAA domain family protein n=1 Tax=Mycobacteroides abscessus subsp. bolletii 1513 TaxID=1299321 RepID=X8DUQ8_9MYCO|nr:AAA domain family protein [Mycobacteroides abscessus subsp. bolletii 1513]
MASATAGYPLSAIVGHDRLRLALVLSAVRPDIGGVLIRGEKGTAKSTAVRALASVLGSVDGARLVELPIGATEDRVVGSLDLQKVLRDGEHAFSPGLLARADGGVLYVDEVNLLHDHLVDVVLDAAAMGRVHVERDGVSHSYDARFVLIGTMNPEEGELRPQLLDRFGFAVDIHASRDVEVRAEVIRRRLAYEADPAGFVSRYAAEEAELAVRIADARQLLARVVLPDAELRRIATLCAAFDVDGMRADLVVARAAIAHAAWRGAETVGEPDIRVAAELALPHRRRRDPFDEPGLDPDQLDQAMRDSAPPQDQDGEDPDPDPDGPGGGAPESAPDPAKASDSQQDSASAAGASRPSPAPSATFRAKTLRVPELVWEPREALRGPQPRRQGDCAEFGRGVRGACDWHLDVRREPGDRTWAATQTGAYRSAVGDKGRPRRQPGDLCGRCLGVHGRAPEDVGSQRRDLVPAA